MTPAEAKAEARRALEAQIENYKRIQAAYYDESKLFASIDAFERAVIAEALATIKTVKLGDLRGIIETINEECTCGGNGPGEGCPACEVYHGIKDMEFKL
jgi:hypothetical protein